MGHLQDPFLQDPGGEAQEYHSQCTVCQSAAVFKQYMASEQGLTSWHWPTSQAGEPGSGKTTFTQNLAALYGCQDGPGAATPAMRPYCTSSGASKFVESFTTKPTTLQDFKTAPDMLCTRLFFTDEAAKIDYRLLIQAGPLRMQHV